MRKVDMEGRVFGRLVVLEYTETINKRRRFKARCDCGCEKVVNGADLRSGRIISCGCFKDAKLAQRNRDNAKHGMTHTGVYRSWFAMIARCERPKSISYPYYGAKGVKVCERWHEFKAFHEDMGDRPEGPPRYTLDRINPYGNYEPGNCRWATYREQRLNKREHYNEDGSRK